MIKADRIVTTTCPYCGVGCALNLHLKQDVVYKVTSPFDSPANRGNLCVKGRFGYDFIHAKDRLSRPMIRRDGELVSATWEEALGYAAGRLLEIREQYGADSIGFLVSAKCTNEENYLLQKAARGLIGTNNVDHCARL
ncbi:MAG: putative formate dehydrogenase [Anaerolineales bacterium]|nr:putative formate dehydrogenase [Anaerolineales bacterium]